MRNELHMVYVTDKGYLMPTTVSMASAYAWCSDPSRLVTHIIDIGISNDNWNEWIQGISPFLPSATRIVRHKLPAAALDGFPTYRGNAATCARAYIPKLMQDIDWCFYVDGDTLFLNDPLKVESIFDPSYAFHAHRDRLENPEDEKVHSDWFGQHGMAWDVNQYGCAGVLLMNLKWFREKDVGQKLIDFMRRYQDSMWPDQDALYWVCRGHVKFLPDEWGMMDDHLWLSKGTLPSCLHYVQYKPWNVTHICKGCLSSIGMEWLKSARILTGYDKSELAKERGELLKPGCNALQWFWRWLFILAGRSHVWRKTHAYRLMHFPPLFVMRHISMRRLKRRLQLIKKGSARLI